MSRVSWIVPLLALGLAGPRPAEAWDEFSDARTPPRFVLRAGTLSLTFKGELEVELHDVDGRGGPGHDSPTDTKTLGTRSPFVELDSFWVALRLGIGEHVGIFSFMDFRPEGSRLGAAWLDLDIVGPSWLRHHLEAGYNSPFVAMDRRTERYPLQATAWWREPELHLVYEARFTLLTRLHLDAGVSLAMMRPLTLAGVQDSTAHPGTINILGLGPARPFSGNGPVGGARLGLDAWGARVEVFGVLGRMAAEGGTDVLRSAFPNYRFLPGDRGSDRHGAFAWAGGRAGYEDHGVRVLLEGILAREDLLTRWGACAQASYEIALPGWQGWLPALEPLLRVETLRILDGDRPRDGHALRSPALANAASWDYDVLTVALIARVYRDLVRLRVEYSFIREHNGVPALEVAGEPFRNDELLVQAEVRF
ncbi:MAG: hypothetical protein FJ098_01915 [Deltaproteobacteria bacterium]|nr:hypothetical protein [Deltaproteobacteria bacterium]